MKIFRKEGPESLENYKSISLLSQIWKRFMEIIINRKKIQTVQSKEKVGFRMNYSTTYPQLDN